MPPLDLVGRDARKHEPAQLPRRHRPLPEPHPPLHLPLPLANPTAVNCFTWPPSESNGLGHLIGPGDSIMEIRKGVPAPDDRDSGEPRNGLLESSELQHFPSCFFATPLLIRWQSFG